MLKTTKKVCVVPESNICIYPRSHKRQIITFEPASLRKAAELCKGQKVETNDL